jgi:CRISPR-associated exonuclease Cas4
MALPLACRRLNLAGVADLVEFRAGAERETAYPVEYKRGKAKLHRADEVQLCAQALCLEEMTGKGVPEGALFYAETRRRVAVPFDAELRQLTEQTALQFGALFASGRTPAAVYRADRCRACSLIEVCRPKAGSRSALAFRAREVDAALDGDGPAS